MKIRVGFIGLGLMGNPMAKNILKSGFALTVYNRTPSKRIELNKLGANVAETPSQLAIQSDVIITMVTGPKDVEDVLFGKNGVIEGAKKGLIVIDMETIGPTAAKKIAKKLKKHGIDFIDAPVTGSTPKAITGELTIFIGGKKEIFKKVEPVLLTMGKNLNYIGPTGSGQAIKMINNHILAVTIETVAEGMILADIMGLSREKAVEVLKTAPVMSPMMNLKSTNFVSGKFPLLFSIANMKKDLSLAVYELKKSKKKLPILQQVEKLYDQAINNGMSQEDFSIIIKVFENKVS